MKSINIDDIIDKIRKTVHTHRLENEGEYSRWLWQNEECNRELGINEYGCADAANILYTIGDFINEPEKRAAWIKVLQSLQNSETGMFTEKTHSVLHTTAHCIAALELFDAKPLHDIEGINEYITPDGVCRLLGSLDWKNDPWSQSHSGAGIFAVMNIMEKAGYEWNRAYFDWLWENTDEDTGMFAPHNICGVKCEKYKYMAGTFHYLFNHEYARMPLRYPEKLIDTCLWMYENRERGELPARFCEGISFIQIDWIYCITRSLRQCGHRHEECVRAIEDFAEKYLDFLSEIDEDTHEGFNDLHALFGVTCALAELQQFLKGKLISKKPLRLVLDRRPFI